MLRKLPHAWRVALPLVAGVLCMLATTLVGPLPAYVLCMVSIGLFIDGLLSMMPTTGGMWAHRQ